MLHRIRQHRHGIALRGLLLLAVLAWLPVLAQAGCDMAGQDGGAHHCPSCDSGAGHPHGGQSAPGCDIAPCPAMAAATEGNLHNLVLADMTPAQAAPPALQRLELADLQTAGRDRLADDASASPHAPPLIHRFCTLLI